MFGNAEKRCHATPHVMWRPTTKSQIMPDISLTNAKIETITALAGSSLATCIVKKSVHGLEWPVIAMRPAFTRIMPRPSSRTTTSTKYAGVNLEPAKRDSRSGMRGWLS